MEGHFQCEQKTQAKDGHLCKKPGKHQIAPGKYMCALHYKAWKEPKAWDTLKLPAPQTIFMTPKALKDLDNKLNERVRPAREGGFLYVYAIPNEDVWLIKIGKTTRDVTDRLDEWAEHHKVEELLRAPFPCDLELAERIVHLYFDWARVYRYPQENGTFYDVWKTTKTPLVEGQAPPEGFRPKASNKHTEWFAIQLHEAERVIEALQAYFISEHKRA